MHGPKHAGLNVPAGAPRALTPPNELCRRLERLGTCDRGLRWAATHAEAEEAWFACEDPEWLLWISRRLGVELELRIRAAIRAARCAQHLGRRAAEEALEAASRAFETPSEVHRRQARVCAEAAYVESTEAETTPEALATAAAFAATTAVLEREDALAEGAARDAAQALVKASEPLRPVADAVRAVIPFPVIAALWARLADRPDLP